MTARIHTYLVHHSVTKVLDEACAHRAVIIAKRKAFRAIIVARKKPEGVHIVKKIPGNCFASEFPWVEANRLIELEREHLASTTRITARKRERAREMWQQASEAVEAAKQSLAEAEKAVDAASEELVRVYGRGPIALVGDDLYDPIPVRNERVVYRICRLEERHA